ncbi:transposase [Embleya sp. NPDC008237]|uniref:transposase n=1 Tax=Embleya sp. NPDC008237 TaxID=3363978 RepID=UPI0036E6CB31
MARRELDDDEWELIEPFLPIGGFGPYPQRLREQFEGVVWRFRTGSQWREMPGEFGPWSTVYDRFRQWRDVGVFAALMDAMIAEAAGRGQVDMSLVGVDSTVVRAHHDAAVMRVDEDVLAALEKAAGRSKGDPGRHKGNMRPGTTTPCGPSAAGSDADAGPD